MGKNTYLHRLEPKKGKLRVQLFGFGLRQRVVFVTPPRAFQEEAVDVTPTCRCVRGVGLCPSILHVEVPCDLVDGEPVFAREVL